MTDLGSNDNAALKCMLCGMIRCISLNFAQIKPFSLSKTNVILVLTHKIICAVLFIPLNYSFMSLSSLKARDSCPLNLLIEVTIKVPSDPLGKLE